MNKRKPDILFIASNIPTPKRKSNRIILTIAEKLSVNYNISVLHPAELAPFPLSLLKKYKHIASRFKWKDGPFFISPLKYLRLPINKLSFMLLCLYQHKIKRFCDKHGVPRLVHAHFVMPDGYFAWIIKKLYSTPYIVSIRCSDIMNMKRLNITSRAFKRYLNVLNKADQLIVHNRYQYNYLHNLGIQSNIFSHGIEKEFFDNQVNKDHNTITISTIAELIPQKNINWVIRSLKEYKGNRKTRLIIAGNGPARKELEKEADGIDAKFMGHISKEEVKKLLSSSHIFALPSINETFGLVFLEATARYNAIISLKNSGVWGHFKQNEEMIFCNSYESFRESLYKLIENKNLREKIARKSYEKSLASYTWETVVKKYNDLYCDLIGEL